MKKTKLLATLLLALAITASAVLAAQTLNPQGQGALGNALIMHDVGMIRSVHATATTTPSNASKLEATLQRLRQLHLRLLRRHDRVIKPDLYSRSMLEFNNDPRFPHD